MRALLSFSLLLTTGTLYPAAESDVDGRVEALLTRMTLTEKVGQLVQINRQTGGVPDALKERLRQGRIGSMLNEITPAASQEIQRIAVTESRLGIPLLMGRDVIHGYRTIFPIPLGQAAAWDAGTVEGEPPALEEHATTITANATSSASADGDGRRGSIGRSVPKTARTCRRRRPSVATYGANVTRR